MNIPGWQQSGPGKRQRIGDPGSGASQAPGDEDDREYDDDEHHDDEQCNLYQLIFNVFLVKTFLQLLCFRD